MTCFEREPKCVQQILFVARPGHAIKDMTDQMSQHLRIGLRTERVTLANKLIPQLLKILDHPVMDECQLPALIQMRMRIFVCNKAVGSPPGMSNPSRTVRRILLNQLR